jgi:periplasmic divalent cation tolerance protein
VSAPSDSGVRVALVTVPEEAADELARSLVRDRIAACVNVLPGVRSHYRWEGRLERSNEALLVLKVRSEGSAEIPARVAERHPYDVPEVLLLDVADGLPAYLRWVVASVGDTP